MKRHFSKYWWAILIINTVLLFLRVFYVTHYDIDLHTEEAQYWLWSKHLALSYYSKPPLIAYLNYLSTSMLGNTELGVRINAIFIGFFLPFILYDAAIGLFRNRRTAFIAVLIFFTMPFYNYISIFFTTDGLLTTFWLLALISGWKSVARDKLKYWMLTGLYIGLGFLSKYTMILFIPFLLSWIVYYNHHLFYRKGIYVTLLTALVVASPVFIWNIQHDLVGIKHVLDLSNIQSSNMSFNAQLFNVLKFLGGQILILSPFYFLFITKGLFRQIRFIDKNWIMTLRYLKLSVFFVWSIFLFISFRKSEINWVLFIYPAVPLIISYIHLRYQQIRVILIPVILTIFLQFLLFVPVTFDLIGAAKLYPPKFDTLHRLAGWKDLSNSMDKILEDVEGEKVFVFSDNYHIASELSFYMEDNPETYIINNGRRMNQFDLWEGIGKFQNKGYNGVYVSSHLAPERLKQMFEKITYKGVLQRYYRGEVVQKLHVYQCERLKKYERAKPKTF